MATLIPAILILDTSVLINFLAIDRAELLARLSSAVLVTQHVVHEVLIDFPQQRERLDAALAAGHLQQIEVTDLAELQIFATLVSRSGSRRKRLGAGECSAIAVAVHRNLVLGIEDRQAIKQVQELYPQIDIRRTQDLMVQLIVCDALSVREADIIKQAWSAEHRFEMKGVNSFADLVPPPPQPPAP